MTLWWQMQGTRRRVGTANCAPQTHTVASIPRPTLHLLETPRPGSSRGPDGEFVWMVVRTRKELRGIDRGAEGPPRKSSPLVCAKRQLMSSRTGGPVSFALGFSWSSQPSWLLPNGATCPTRHQLPLTAARVLSGGGATFSGPGVSSPTWVPPTWHMPQPPRGTRPQNRFLLPASATCRAWSLVAPSSACLPRLCLCWLLIDIASESTGVKNAGKKSCQGVF